MLAPCLIDIPQVFFTLSAALLTSFPRFSQYLLAPLNPLYCPHPPPLTREDVSISLSEAFSGIRFFFLTSTFSNILELVPHILRVSVAGGWSPFFFRLFSVSAYPLRIGVPIFFGIAWSGDEISGLLEVACITETSSGLSLIFSWLPFFSLLPTFFFELMNFFLLNALW